MHTTNLLCMSRFFLFYWVSQKLFLFSFVHRRLASFDSRESVDRCIQYESGRTNIKLSFAECSTTATISDVTLNSSRTSLQDQVKGI